MISVFLFLRHKKTSKEVLPMDFLWGNRVQEISFYGTEPGLDFSTICKAERKG